MITYSRSTNLILVLRSYLFFLFHGKANKKPPTPPKRVTVLFLTKNIGDMIFATPVFRALKEKYPNCYLSVIGVAKNKAMVEGNSDVDNYLICPSTVKELINLIRESRPDYAFPLLTSVLDVGVLYLAGVSSIGAFSVKNAKAHTLGYSLLLPLCIQVPYFIGKYAAQEYLRLLEPINIYSSDTRKRLYFTNKGKQSVEEFFRKNNFNPQKDRLAIFSPGAGTKIKQWPAERFALVAEYLSEKHNMKIAVIGGPGDKTETETFLHALKKTKPLVYVDSSLDELKTFISYGTVLLANDSGPVYIAEAFCVATLVVVGPTDENEHPPKGERNSVVTSPSRGKAEMTGHLEGFDKGNARRQIEDVTVNSVIREVDSLIIKL